MVWQCAAQLVVRVKCHRINWAFGALLLFTIGGGGDEVDGFSPTENISAIYHGTQLEISMLYWVL